MSNLPSRLAEMQAAIERGEPVDQRRLARLQALDIALSGRKHVQEALDEEAAADEQFRKLLEAGTNAP